jgi:UDP-3-O-[3-hydroxymyristoyl] N-acetylglucosamine deacetylase
MLDAIGDLALAGAPLLGVYRTVHGGHKLNYAALSALMADTSAWTLTEGEPTWPARSHADLGSGLTAPAYAPDVS